ncbi:uncharacterized protein FFMR_00219 [Fusarium fujikuroi]|nr:uncharacterized protein FFMR_00219 [Fusarium fujikuroi]
MPATAGRVTVEPLIELRGNLVT